MTFDRGQWEAVELRLGYRFRDQDSLLTALTHSSAAQSTQPRVGERLEFLGDAVLGLVLTEFLIVRYPRENEGRLSKFRALLVSTTSFAAKARELQLNECILLGKGEEKTGGREKASILAAAYEAVIGAIFLEAGYDGARDVVREHFRDSVDAVRKMATNDAKTELQELCQQICRVTPVYRVVEETGPDHARRFVVTVSLGDSPLASGEGGSKRRAEQAAARAALDRSAELVRTAERLAQ
jgi:ribonuclease-3